MDGYIDDRHFALIDFIKSHPDDWEETLNHSPYSLKQIRPCTWHANWYMFVYHLSRSLLTDPVVRNCRGVALEIDGKNVKPISVAYTKFFNYGQTEGADIEAAINWKNAKFQMKVDGILIKTACLDEPGVGRRLYFFTNGSFDLNVPIDDPQLIDEPETQGAELYGDLLEYALKKIDTSATIHFNRDNGCFYLTGGWTDNVELGSTMIFELISPRNKIICEYRETKLLLHGYRDPNLIEKDPRTVDFGVKFEYPELLDASSYDDLMKIINTFNGQYEEGCVVVDYTTPGIPRTKIKCESYLQLKLSTDNACNAKVLFRAIIAEEDDDIVAIVPSAAEKIAEIKAQIKVFTTWFYAEAKRMKEMFGEFSSINAAKKQYALWCDANNIDRKIFQFYMMMPYDDLEQHLMNKLRHLSAVKTGYRTLCYVNELVSGSQVLTTTTSPSTQNSTCSPANSNA